MVSRILLMLVVVVVVDDDDDVDDDNDVEGDGEDTTLTECSSSYLSELSPKKDEDNNCVKLA